MTEVRYGEGVSDVRADVVSYALQFVGNRYVWGGTSLTNGVDCSGFTMQILAKYGISLPHSSAAQPAYGTKISASAAQPGDLFFYGSGSQINHVGMYIGGGQIVHASGEKTGIKISNAFYRTPICVVSYLN
jgi:cell wall-associated NlpC family hydrolase